MTQRIHFNEVVTRDGFQMEPEFVPTEAKIALIDLAWGSLLTGLCALAGRGVAMRLS
jgi:hypothetical protein